MGFESAHLAHIQLPGQGVHHASGTQKEQGFEEGVSHQVKDPGGESPDAASQEHISQLADG